MSQCSFLAVFCPSLCRNKLGYKTEDQNHPEEHLQNTVKEKQQERSDIQSRMVSLVVGQERRRTELLEKKSRRGVAQLRCGQTKIKSLVYIAIKEPSQLCHHVITM